MDTLKLGQNRHGVDLEIAMRRILLALLCATLFCQEVRAEQPHQISVGMLGQAKASTRSPVPSVGAWSMFQLGGEYSEIHASAWMNVGETPGGGVGGGTIHHLKSSLFLGWELSAEYEAEEEEEIWFLGVGPLFEAAASERLHIFLKLPLGWEHSQHHDRHHDRFGWAVVAGLSVTLWR